MVALWLHNKSDIAQIPSLYIDDQIVTKKEYEQAVKDTRHEVVKYFKEKSKITLNEDWDMKIDGEVPVEVLSEHSIRYLSKRAAIYQLAKHDGIIDNASYESMLSRMEKENDIREERKKARNAVYGLSQFTKESYEAYEKDAFKKFYCQLHNVDEAAYYKMLEEDQKNKNIKVDKKQLYEFTGRILKE